MQVGDLVEVHGGDGGWGMIVGWFDIGDGCDRLHPIVQFYSGVQTGTTEWAHIENCEVINASR